MDSELISNSKISDIVIIQSSQKYPKKKLSFTPMETNSFNITFNEGKIISLIENEKEKIDSQKKLIEENLKKNSTQINDNIIDNNISDINNKNDTEENKLNSIIKNLKKENKLILQRATSAKEEITFVQNKNKNKNKLERRLNSSSTYCSPKKNYFRPKPKKAVSSNHLNFNQEEVESLSNMEDITNFYTYTERCFQLMIEIEKSNKIYKCKPLDFPFDEQINSGKKKLAIFDLDETLVHCQAKNIEECQFQICVNLPSNKKGKIGINIRPNWKKALNLIKDNYVIIVFTASHRTYADAVLDFMDASRSFFPYRLYRNNCTCVKIENKEIYIKDLSLFKNIDLKNIIIIDNSVVSFTYNLNNGIPILPYYDSIQDNELLALAYYLNGIFKYDDLKEANKKFVKLEYYKIKAIEKIKIEEEEEEEEEEEIEEYNGLKAENQVNYSTNELIYNNDENDNDNNINNKSICNNKNDSNYVDLGTLTIIGSNIENESNNNYSSFKKGVMNYPNELKKSITSLRHLFKNNCES